MLRSTEQVTRILTTASASAESASDAMRELAPLVYEELLGLARRALAKERADHTLQPTALVHEAYVRLVDGVAVDLQGRTHFLALAARKIRQVLVDSAREHNAQKRGGDAHRVFLERIDDPAAAVGIDTLALEDALQRLEARSERAARVVEMRFLAGMSVEDVARSLGVSPGTVKGDWRMARAWLKRTMQAEEADD